MCPCGLGIHCYFQLLLNFNIQIICLCDECLDQYKGSKSILCLLHICGHMKDSWSCLEAYAIPIDVVIDESPAFSRATVGAMHGLLPMV